MNVSHTFDFSMNLQGNSFTMSNFLCMVPSLSAGRLSLKNWQNALFIFCSQTFFFLFFSCSCRYQHFIIDFSVVSDMKVFAIFLRKVIKYSWHIKNSLSGKVRYYTFVLSFIVIHSHHCCECFAFDSRAKEPNERQNK